MDFNICLVCSSPPKPGTQHHSHYGAICCMSCKAFFKRIRDEAVNKSGSESCLKYKCKKKDPGSCNTHYQISTKDKCKECRYLKCIGIGMDPNQICAGDLRHKFTRNNLYCFAKSPKINEVKEGQGRDLSQMMTKIVNAYEASVAEVQLSKDMVEFIFEGHLNGTEWTSEYSKAVLRAMDMHPRSLALMASKLTFFQESICKEDQHLLLEENLPLFYQYILGRYLMDKGGSTQLSWLLAADAEKTFGNMVKNTFYYQRKVNDSI